jgi:hypothetical protein
MGKTKKRFTHKDFNSGDGMLTSVWGPPLWHFIHTLSFNFPVKPTRLQKREYKKFILNLKHILPCKYCRINLTKNLKSLPLQMKNLKDRDAFSRWVYHFHEKINTMLNKKSGLTFEEVRDRYENFRSKCKKKERKKTRKRKRKEKGCVTPLKGRKKAKCIIKIVPQEKPGKTFQMDKKGTL